MRRVQVVVQIRPRRLARLQVPLLGHRALHAPAREPAGRRDDLGLDVDLGAVVEGPAGGAQRLGDDVDGRHVVLQDDRAVSIGCRALLQHRVDLLLVRSHGHGGRHRLQHLRAARHAADDLTAQRRQWRARGQRGSVAERLVGQLVRHRALRGVPDGMGLQGRSVVVPRLGGPVLDGLRAGLQRDLWLVGPDLRPVGSNHAQDGAVRQVRRLAEVRLLLLPAREDQRHWHPGVGPERDIHLA
mmetsp:Transcript_40866/g.104143  ORF Transcript_40866/g.104143 Transcript_40866/m.104143 type:complete len:242 (-) Transcript_40866:632-1357(-)